MPGSVLDRALLCSTLATAACRLNFDPLHDAGDTAITDSTEAGTLTTLRFGERGSSDQRGVTSDAYIDENLPTLNYGASNTLSVDTENQALNLTLLRFDLSALAPGTRVIAARHELEARQFNDASAGNVNVAALAESWVEGTRDGTPGTGATWLERATGSPWATAGAPKTSRSIGDHVGVAASGPLVIELDATAVQAWVDDAAQNFGLVISPTSPIHQHYFASDAGMTEARPQLSIDVTR